MTDPQPPQLDEEIPAETGGRKPPQPGRRLHPRDRPDPAVLRAQREQATKRRQWNRTRR